MSARRHAPAWMLAVAALAAAPAALAAKDPSGDVKNAKGLSAAQRKALDIVAVDVTRAGSSLTVQVRTAGDFDAQAGKGKLSAAGLAVVLDRGGAKVAPVVTIGPASRPETGTARSLGTKATIVRDGRDTWFLLSGAKLDGVKRLVAGSVALRLATARALPVGPAIVQAPWESLAAPFKPQGKPKPYDPAGPLPIPTAADCESAKARVQRLTKLRDHLAFRENTLRDRLNDAQSRYDDERERNPSSKRLPQLENVRDAFDDQWQRVRNEGGDVDSQIKAAQKLADEICQAAAGADDGGDNPGGSPGETTGGCTGDSCSGGNTCTGEGCSGGNTPPASPTVNTGFGTDGEMYFTAATAGSGEFRSGFLRTGQFFFFGDAAASGDTTNRNLLSAATTPTGGRRLTARDTDGTFVTPIDLTPNGNDYGYAIAPGLGTTSVFAGQAAISGIASNALVGRFTTLGTLDNSFDSDGFNSIDFGGGSDRATAVAVDASGNVYIGASFANADGFKVAKFLSTGALDTAGFGTGGIATVPIGTSSADAVNGLSVDSGTGNVTVVGTVDANTPGAEVGLAQLTSAGVLVGGFGTSGKTVTATAGLDSVGGFAVDGSGRVVVSATNNDPSGHVRWSLARYANGVLDSGFNGGVLITQVGSQDFAVAGGVAIQPSGKIIQVGGAFHGGNAGDEDMAMVRYQGDADGGLDSTFGTGGKKEFDIGGLNDYAATIVLHGSGTKALLAGGCTVGSLTEACAADFNVP